MDPTPAPVVRRKTPSETSHKRDRGLPSPHGMAPTLRSLTPPEKGGGRGNIWCLSYFNRSPPFPKQFALILPRLRYVTTPHIPDDDFFLFWTTLPNLTHKWPTVEIKGQIGDRVNRWGFCCGEAHVPVPQRPRPPPERPRADLSSASNRGFGGWGGEAHTGPTRSLFSSLETPHQFDGPVIHI